MTTIIEDTEAQITLAGALSVQACVPTSWTDDQVRTFAEQNYPCGATAGWCIRAEGDERLAGYPERNPCAARAGFVHIMLDA